MREDVAVDAVRLDARGTPDPYPSYAALRDGPVRQVALHGLQAWLVTRYDDARAVLNDPGLSNDRRHANPAARSAAWLFADEAFDLQHHMLRSDPPDHTRIRRVAAPAFTASRVAELAPRIQRIADALVDTFAGGRAELVSEYAFPLTLRVILEVMGIPEEHRGQLLHWSGVLSSGRPAGEAEVTGTLAALKDRLGELIAEDRAGSPGHGLLHDLVTARDRDGELSEPELRSSAFQLLQGGHVTTLGLIVNAALALLRNPEHLAAVRADPDLLEAGTDELLRLDPPMTAATVRFTTRELRIGPVVIPGDGQPVVVLLGAANRDPVRFPDPDRLHLGRDCTGHLGFGYGVHRCLGARLARVEARIALSTLVTRLPGLRLAVDPDRLTWLPNPHLRRPVRLPVAFRAVARSAVPPPSAVPSAVPSRR